MELKNLRTALFGFNKKDVCEYIAQLNEEFLRKLDAEKEKSESEAAQLQARLDGYRGYIEKIRDDVTQMLQNDEEQEHEQKV